MLACYETNVFCSLDVPFFSQKCCQVILNMQELLQHISIHNFQFSGTFNWLGEEFDQKVTVMKMISYMATGVWALCQQQYILWTLSLWGPPLQLHFVTCNIGPVLWSVQDFYFSSDGESKLRHDENLPVQATIWGKGCLLWPLIFRKTLEEHSLNRQFYSFVGGFQLLGEPPASIWWWIWEGSPLVVVSMCRKGGTR